MLVQVRGPHLGWRGQIGVVLETWIELQHRFYERIGRPAYCYSERTNVGLFAAAAWRCNQIAVEEFATRKGNGWRGPGRVDLFVQIGRCALCVEAKAIHLRAPQDDEEWRIFWRLLRACVGVARHEAARASRGSFRHRLGIVFCLISTKLTPSFPNWRREFARHLDVQAPRQTLDFLAAYMPSGRLPAELQCYPGVILAGSATRAAHIAMTAGARRTLFR
jgi:hypothetical protein